MSHPFIEGISISIHALVKRATKDTHNRRHLPLNFNPRPREEGDCHGAYHCPASKNFNPRPREEGDTRGCCKLLICGYFNPRPREEGDSKFIQ